LRAILVLGLFVAAVAAGCGITSSTSEPIGPAPTRTPGEQPSQVVAVAGRSGGPLTLQVFDRSLALGEARTATAAELDGIDDLPPNAVGIYQTKVGDLLLIWTASDCPSAADMFVSPGVTEIVVVPALDVCEGDPTLRGVYLHFDPTVDPKRVSFRVAAATSG
jgi:hypothetical protein